MAEIPSSRQPSTGQKNADSSLRSYQLAEKKYLSTRSSARALFGIGTVLLYAGIIQLSDIIETRRLFPDGIFPIGSLILCLILFLAAYRTLKQSHAVKILADEERRLANELIEWFITTYSSEQIDHQIEAISPLSGTPEILCLKRLDMIRILTEREYDRNFDEEFLDQVCEDLYNMLFEKEPPLS